MKQLFTSYFSQRAFALKSLVLSLFIASAFMSGVGEVEAVSFGIGGAAISFDTNKTSFMPGETIYVSGSGASSQCGNSGAYYVTLSIIFGGSTVSIWDGSEFGNKNSYFSTTFGAPGTPGSYKITARACELIDGNSCVSADIWITVLPANYGQACASAGNACGQVNWGTIQANGACSVSAAPANPASLGASCASAGNMCGQVNWGTIQCNGACSATTPSNAGCIPVTPGWISGSCPSPGSTANLSWGGVGGATYYALRVDNQTSGGWSGTCTGGGDFCADIGATSYSFGSSPSNTYNTWVHACNAAGCSAGAASSGFTCAATPINGSCGSSNGGTFSTQPTTNNCSVGAVSWTDTTAGDGSYNWSCAGANGGTNASCSAAKTVIPAPVLSLSASPATIVEGDSSALTWTVTGTADSCWASGGWTGWKTFSGTNAENVTPAVTTTYNLECWNQGASSGLKSATVTVNPTPINGSCGSSNGGTFSTQPTTNNCSVGAVSWTDTTAGDGSYNWSCAGANGGTNASCSAAKTVIPCNSEAKTWIIGGNTCEANTSMTLSGGNDTVYDSVINTASPATGNATFMCTNGIWASNPNAGATCVLSPELTVNKRMVEQGTQVTITWILHGQTDCTLTGNGLNQTVSVDSTINQTINGRTTFTLACPSGTDTVTVEVVPRGFET